MQISKREYNMLNMLFDVACDVTPVKTSRHAAAILKRGIPVAMGINLNKTDPIHRRVGCNYKTLIHAECAAIKRAAAKLKTESLKDCTLVVVRSKMDQNQTYLFGNSKPCHLCESIINNFHIRRVIYSIESNCDNPQWDLLC
jgi:tRNA(Arg) A34 adenosine deaminase TadA